MPDLDGVDMDVGEELARSNEEFASTNKDFMHLGETRHPKLVVLACSDPRVAPKIVFKMKLGDVFDIRTAGGMAGEDEIASIEYAVSHPGVKDMACGGGKGEAPVGGLSGALDG